MKSRCGKSMVAPALPRDRERATLEVARTWCTGGGRAARREELATAGLRCGSLPSDPEPRAKAISDAL
jgi:hypothetical protein